MDNATQQLKKHLALRFPHMSEEELNESVENLLAFAEVITDMSQHSDTESAVLTDSTTSSTMEGNQ